MAESSLFSGFSDFPSASGRFLTLRSTLFSDLLLMVDSFAFGLTTRLDFKAGFPMIWTQKTITSVNSKDLLISMKPFKHQKSEMEISHLKQNM